MVIFPSQEKVALAEDRGGGTVGSAGGSDPTPNIWSPGCGCESVRLERAFVGAIGAPLRSSLLVPECLSLSRLRHLVWGMSSPGTENHRDMALFGHGWTWYVVVLQARLVRFLLTMDIPCSPSWPYPGPSPPSPLTGGTTEPPEPPEPHSTGVESFSSICNCPLDLPR
ncbi:hypothetical protein GE09DRAFT_1103360, partial [Coniochaeta sp. 2T2.1]